jgi:hypothetical protein
MAERNWGLGLGIVSIAIGVAELAGARRIARRLETPGGARLVRAFGVRELVAGAGLLAAPGHSARVWSRVAGDGLDLATLGVALRRHPRNRAIWGTVAFVLGTTLVDIVAARRLDGRTGRTFPA